jgi:hypothetical protein
MKQGSLEVKNQYSLEHSSTRIQNKRCDMGSVGNRPSWMYPTSGDLFGIEECAHCNGKGFIPISHCTFVEQERT